jgi:hypothetical protein
MRGHKPAQKTRSFKMKHTRIFLSAAVLLCAAAIFTGCPTEAGDDDDGIVRGVQDKEFTISDDDGIKYYSLKTGDEVTDAAKIASKDWDIAFQRSRIIYTNSGATAANAGSGGQGGVWFTDKTDFDDVSSDEDRVETTGENAEYAGFTQDVTKYMAGGGMGGGSEPTTSVLNVMTYVGYYGGTGTADDPYTTVPLAGPPGLDYLPYLYNKKHFVSMTNMRAGEFAVSNQVYIIKHGDGTHYSKMQITEYTSRSADTSAEPPVPAADILTVK